MASASTSLAHLARELRKPESEIMTMAFEAGLRQLWRERTMSQYLRGEIPREEAVERAGLDWVDLAEQQHAAKSASCQMEIHTFAPEPYRVKRPIPVMVREHDSVFLASFVDANINASGETAHEAFEIVKALILDMFDHLSWQARLGPKLAKTLAVLREFIDGP